METVFNARLKLNSLFLVSVVLSFSGGIQAATSRSSCLTCSDAFTVGFPGFFFFFFYTTTITNTKLLKRLLPVFQKKEQSHNILVMPLCLDFISSEFHSAKHFRLVCFFKAVIFLALPSLIDAFTHYKKKILLSLDSLSHCLLGTMRVVFVMTVLSFQLLVTEEVAPPAARVVHLFG